MTYPFRELTVVALFSFFIYLFTFYFLLLLLLLFFTCLCLCVNDTDLNQCFGLFSSILYVQQS